jgi:hypothetical protein
MAFRPAVEQEILIDDVVYRFVEHPAAPGMPYGQEGRAATVYKLLADSAYTRALKVFKPSYRSPVLAEHAEKVAPLATLPGLQVCRRTVMTPSRHIELLQTYPDLQYAVLMPWIEAPTWFDVIYERRSLSPEQSLNLADALLQTLVTMEHNGLAHCDLSGPNVLLPTLFADRTASSEETVSNIELVDIEDLYGPGLTRPEKLLGGSPGYASATASSASWSAEADRFTGAVLLVEMLGWCDEHIRQIAHGEQYFDPAEMQRDTERVKLLLQVLRECWNQAIAELFTELWFAKSNLTDCPSFRAWQEVLRNNVASSSGSLSLPPMAVSKALTEPRSEVSSAGASAVLESAAENIYQMLRTQVEQGNLVEAERLAQALNVLQPNYRDAELLITRAREWESRAQQMQAEVIHYEAHAAQAKTQLEQQIQSLDIERQALEAQLQALVTRKDEMLHQDEALTQIRSDLADIAPLLTERRWIEATTRLAQAAAALAALPVIQVLPSAPAGSAAPITEIESPPPTEVKPSRKKSISSLRVDASPEAWVEQLQKIHVLEYTGVKLPRAKESISLPHVFDVAFSPDGKLLATANSDHRVWLWNVADGKFITVLEGHQGEVRSVNFTPDGRLLISGGRERMLRLWDMSNYKQVSTIDNFTPVNVTAIAPNGQFLVAGSVTVDSNVRLWNLKGQRLHILTGHTQEICDLAFSSKGNLLASTARDGIVYLWDMQEYGIERRFETEKYIFESLTFIPDTNILVGGKGDGSIKMFNSLNGVEVRTLKGHTRSVRSLTISQAGTVLASGGEDGFVILWERRNATKLRTLEIGSVVYRVTFSPRGDYLAIGTAGDSAQIWGPVNK